MSKTQKMLLSNLFPGEPRYVLLR